MWPCNKYPLCHLTLNFVLCFSTELDVEDFDAFLEKVKARSLGNSPFACKFRLALKKEPLKTVFCMVHTTSDKQIVRTSEGQHYSFQGPRFIQ